MKTLIVNTLMAFVSADMIASVFARCIAKLLRYAQSKGGQSWKKAKAISKDAERWIALFNQVYDDDMLTSEEEEKIAQAIADMTALKNIDKILKQ